MFENSHNVGLGKYVATSYSLIKSQLNIHIVIVISSAMNDILPGSQVKSMYQTAQVEEFGPKLCVETNPFENVHVL